METFSYINCTADDCEESESINGLNDFITSCSNMGRVPRCCGAADTNGKLICQDSPAA